MSTVNNVKQSKGWFISFFSIFIICMVSITITFLKSSGIYDIVCILPTFFTIISFLFINVYMSVVKKPILGFIVGGYFIRLVITPMFFCLGDCKSFYTVIPSEENVVLACIFLIAECTAAFAVCRSFIRNEDQTVPIDSKAYDMSGITFIIVALSLFLVIACIWVPQILDVYKPFYEATISQTTNLTWDNETIVARTETARYVYSLFTVIWPIVRLLLPALLIDKIYNRYGTSKRAIAMSVFSLLIPFAFLSNSSISPITAIILILFMMYRVYGKKTKPIIVSGLTVIGIVAVIAISAKVISWMEWRGSEGLTVAGQMLNAYFPGFENITYTLSIDNNQKLDTLLFDFYYAIPFKETLFGLEGNGLQELFTQTSRTSGQILPFAAQIGHYASYILSPFITGFFVKLALKYDSKSKATNNYWQMFLYTYLAFLTALSINLYSFSIYLRNLICIALPIYILVRFVRHKNKRTEININTPKSKFPFIK